MQHLQECPNHKMLLVGNTCVAMQVHNLGAGQSGDRCYLLLGTHCPQISQVLLKSLAGRSIPWDLGDALLPLAALRGWRRPVVDIGKAQLHLALAQPAFAQQRLLLL